MGAVRVGGVELKTYISLFYLFVDSTHNQKHVIKVKVTHRKMLKREHPCVYTGNTRNLSGVVVVVVVVLERHGGWFGRRAWLVSLGQWANSMISSRSSGLF